MQSSVSVYCNGMAVHLTRSDCQVLRSAVHPMQWICCGMAIQKMGMLGVNVKKMDALTAKETVILMKGDKI